MDKTLHDVLMEAPDPESPPLMEFDPDGTISAPLPLVVAAGYLSAITEHQRKPFLEAYEEADLKILQRLIGEEERTGKLARERAVAERMESLAVGEDAQRGRRREKLAELGESGWRFPSLREAYENLGGKRQQPTIGRWSRMANLDGHPSEWDGHGILYARKISLIFGPSESGKSMFSFAIIAQEVLAGHYVVVVDFEDDEYGLVARLTDLGLDIEQIDPGGAKPGGVYYIPARLGMEDDDFALVRGVAQEHGEDLTLILIDAVTEAMSADGLNPDKAVEVAAWGASMPKRFALLGPGVAIIDHTNLTDADRAQGSQHKKSMVDGVSLKVSRSQTFIPGRGGAASICVAKDRIGSIREQSVPADPEKPGQMEYRGTFVINPPGDGNDPFAMIGRDPMDLDRQPEKKDEELSSKATMDLLIKEVVRVVGDHPGAGKDAVADYMETPAARGKKSSAIDEAVRQGFIRLQTEARGKKACYPMEPEEGVQEELS